MLFRSTGHLERIVFNQNGEQRREELLKGLHQRIRYVQQGPDELVYLLTDDADGALLRLEPTDKAEYLSVNSSNGTPVAVVDEKDAINDLPLFASQDCKLCHRSNANGIGPGYANIAKRYPLNDANVALLVGKVIKGGEGVWEIGRAHV